MVPRKKHPKLDQGEPRIEARLLKLMVSKGAEDHVRGRTRLEGKSTA